MRYEILNIHLIRNEENKIEMEFSYEFNKATYLCGKLFTDGDMMKLYVDGLLPKIHTVVARYREDQLSSTIKFEWLVQ